MDSLGLWIVGLLLINFVLCSCTATQLPPFADLKRYYPGYYHFGGAFRNHELIDLLGIENKTSLLPHDTTALRLSYALNRIGGEHSLGNDMIRLSKYGTDSVSGSDGTQLIFHPLAFGPYLADKYGYPTVTKMHLLDPTKTKDEFTGKQGIMRVITYTQHDNEPKGHVVLWDCKGFHESRDFFVGHTLLSVEFWESPDSNCSDKSSSTQDKESFLFKLLRKSNRRHPRKHRVVP